MFTIVGLGYLLLTLGMYDEKNMQFISASVKALPPGLSAAVGMDRVPTSLTGFVADYFYGFLVQLLTTLYAAIVPIRLIVSNVDQVSMSYLLSTPNSRVKIVVTQALYLVVSLGAMTAVLTAAAMVFSGIVHPVQLRSESFIDLNFAIFLLSVALGAIANFFSCMFNETNRAIAVSTAVLGGFFVLSVVDRIGHGEGASGVIDRLTIFHFLDARQMVNGETNLWFDDRILALIAAAGFAGGIASSRRTIYRCRGAGIVRILCRLISKWAPIDESIVALFLL